MKWGLRVDGKASCAAVCRCHGKAPASSKLCGGGKKNLGICILSRELAQVPTVIERGTVSPNLVPPHFVSQIHTSKLSF